MEPAMKNYCTGHRSIEKCCTLHSGLETRVFGAVLCSPTTICRHGHVEQWGHYILEKRLPAVPRSAICGGRLGPAGRQLFKGLG